MSTVDELMTVEEAAAYLRTEKRFVRRLVAERRIAFHKVGKFVRFRRSDVEAFVEAGRREPIVVRWRRGRAA